MRTKLIVFLIAFNAGLAAFSVGAMDMPYHPPKPYELETLYKQANTDCPKKDWPCFENELYGFAMTYGPKAAIDTFELLKTSHAIPVTIDAHHVVHHIGHHTAMAFGSNIQAFDLCPSDYDYGCQHGFFQYALSEGGLTEAAAIKMCVDLQADASVSAKTKYECYHGLGHGVMMHEGHDLKKSLKVCDSLKSSTGQDGCWQGVFMENVDVAEEGQWQKGMFSTQDPLAPCDRVSKKHQYECFINHSGWLMKFYKNDIGRGAHACLKSPAAQVDTCIQTLGLLTTNAAWQPALLQAAYTPDFIGNAWTLCKKFPQGYVGKCALSALDNLINTTLPDASLLHKAQSFCSVVATEFRSDCYKQIGQDLRYLTPDSKAARDACLFLQGDTEQRQCLSTAGS